VEGLVFYAVSGSEYGLEGVQWLDNGFIYFHYVSIVKFVWRVVHEGVFLFNRPDEFHSDGHIHDRNAKGNHQGRRG
jgi:hypothetical protein